MKNLVRRFGMLTVLAGLVVIQPAGAQQAGNIRPHEKEGELRLHPTQKHGLIVASADEKADKIDPRLVSAGNRFGFEMYRLLAKEGRNKNILISPTSIALALSMTWNGAAGQTETAMAGALQLQGISKEAANRANASLITDLNSGRSGVRMNVANSLWVGKSTTIKPEFIQRNQTFYHAEIGDLAGAPDSVNQWVSKQTNGKIKNILSQADVPKALTSLILANAVYFKGQWLHPFFPTATKSAPFTRQDGSKTECQMMTTSAEFLYFKGNGFQAVSLPYGEKGPAQISMILILPDVSSSIASFQAGLTEANWTVWMQKLASGRGTVDLPRFGFEYEADLKPSLKSLGMGIAFDPNRADFSNMSRTKEYIGVVKHKTYIKVDEKGTEAAAATAVGMFTRAIPSQRPFHITFDRPFICAIRDDASGAILFLGSVVDPLVK